MRPPHEFCDTCEGCRPAILDLKAGKPLKNDTPAMKAVNCYWDNDTSYAQRKAYIEVTVNNSRDSRDLKLHDIVIQNIERILREIYE